MNYYADAIKILKTITPEMEHNLLYDIAAINPVVIVRANKPKIEKPKVDDNTWKYKCAEWIDKGQMIQAIKEYRTITGKGLIESKAVMDKFKINEYRNYLPY